MKFSAPQMVLSTAFGALIGLGTIGAALASPLPEQTQSGVTALRD